MRTVTLTLSFLAVPLALSLEACASSPAPSVRAAEVERVQCDTGTPEQDAELLRGVTVLRVRPLYSHILTGNNNSEERVNGAQLLVRPPVGMSAEALTRILQCHSARVVLGRASPTAVPNDPYWLAEGWLDIDVRPEQGNFEVTLSADSVSNGIRVLGRANRYADDHMLATGSALP